MTSFEIQTIRRVIALLGSLIDDPRACPGIAAVSPVRRFVQVYLTADPNAELTCQEAWEFFQEIVAAGELTAMRQASFFRELPVLIEVAFHVRKCHHVEREGRHQRGFKGVGIRSDA